MGRRIDSVVADLAVALSRNYNVIIAEEAE
jgi:hypothetical protein